MIYEGALWEMLPERTLNAEYETLFVNEDRRIQ